MLHSLQQYCKEIIEGKKKGFFPKLIKMMLYPCSLAFGMVVASRNWAFDRRWFRCYSPPVPVVISVGNIVAGGTGKTPAVELIARELIKDYTLAILSRGYRSDAEHRLEPTFLSKGHGLLQDASVCGDEPCLLSMLLPEAIVIVGKNRREASIMASKAGAQIILLDDGMQHRRIVKDFEVVILNARDLFGRGYLLPRGFLREKKSALSRANFIIINHVNNQEHFVSLKKEILPYTSAPMIATRMETTAILDLAGQVVDPKGKKVGIFCGIAHPDSFKTCVENLGLTVVAEKFTPDHILLTEEQLHQFSYLSKEAGADFLICTEKDKVKINPNQHLSVPILYLQSKLQIVDGHSEWQQFLSRIRTKIL